MSRIIYNPASKLGQVTKRWLNKVGEFLILWILHPTNIVSARQNPPWNFSYKRGRFHFTEINNTL